jgi:hypothetical protein
MYGDEIHQTLTGLIISWMERGFSELPHLSESVQEGWERKEQQGASGLGKTGKEGV